MKKDFLFPQPFKKIGWVLAIPAAILMLCFLFNLKPFGVVIDEVCGGLLDEAGTTLLTLGLLFISFSRERDEDEYVARLRTSCLVRAVIINYVILLVATWALYDMGYLSFMMVNMFTILILYIILFHVALWRFRKSVRYEE